MRRYRTPKFLLVRASRRRRRKETTSRNGTLKLPRGSDAKESQDNFLRLDIYARSPWMLPGPSSYLCPFREPPIVTKTYPRSCNIVTRINGIYILTHIIFRLNEFLAHMEFLLNYQTTLNLLSTSLLRSDMKSK